jgi:t-SNARE complex subunit (syntaxin)
MKQTIEDHKNEILRYEAQAQEITEWLYYIKHKARERQKLLEEIEGVIRRRKDQIIEAVLRGKDSFESDRFMRDRRIK